MMEGKAQIRCGRGMTPACQWGPALSSQASVYVGVGVCLVLEGCMDQALIKALMKALMEAIARKGITH